ncbi:MAG TPA: hypothetical protein DEX10_02635 [Betaproteobacteria bacterium]|nr:hypothetical protein [Betaproteobacteria bacterium]
MDGVLRSRSTRSTRSTRWARSLGSIRAARSPRAGSLGLVVSFLGDTLSRPTPGVAGGVPTSVEPSVCVTMRGLGLGRAIGTMASGALIDGSELVTRGVLGVVRGGGRSILCGPAVLVCGRAGSPTTQVGRLAFGAWPVIAVGRFPRGSAAGTVMGLGGGLEGTQRRVELGSGVNGFNDGSRRGF